MKTLTTLLAILVLSSCSSVGYIAGGKSKTYEGLYVLPLHQSVEASKSKLKSILYADGWNKVKEDDTIIDFENASSKGSELGLGKYNRSSIKAEFSASGISLAITQSGNYNFGTEKSVNKTFNAIKAQYNAQHN